ncbi:MAG: flagellar motor protein MotD [Burkholderiales bacterium]|nr:flagellar motor protein MotD [Burkholderiales bacterium]
MARRKRHEEHENHERWLVSYADFITLLFAFFVVMYAISTLNEGKYRVLADALIVAFRHDPVVTAQTAGLSPINRTTSSAPPRPSIKAPIDTLRKQKGEKMLALAKNISEALKPLVQSGQVRMTQLPHGLAVEINASVLFAPAQAALQPDSVAALEAVAKLLVDAPQQIRVEGHTDNLPIASLQYPSNWELSSARAASVVRLFTATGVDASRLSAVGYADNKPVEANDTPEGRARNRRVTLMILEDLTTAQGGAAAPSL